MGRGAAPATLGRVWRVEPRAAGSSIRVNGRVTGGVAGAVVRRLVRALVRAGALHRDKLRQEQALSSLAARAATRSDRRRKSHGSSARATCEYAAFCRFFYGPG